MSDLPILDQAREAILHGKRGKARELLSPLLNTDKDDPELWLLMSSVVDSKKERTYCLQAALKLDPDNQAARHGLTLLGVTPPDESIEPVPPVRRKWDVNLEEEQLTGFARIMANPVLRILTFSLGGILVVGLVLLGIFATPGSLFRSPPTSVPSWTPTATLTATPTPLVRTPTPTPATAVPLWMLLDSTYTPVPVYVNTPHTLSEAYRSGMRSYERGNYDSMLNFMLQAVRNEPESPDLHYHIGEAYRLKEDYENALEAYNQAIEINSRFAPAHLGRARVQPFLNPRVDFTKDLENAIKFDPAFGEAYLVMADYLNDQSESAETILEFLQTGEEALINNPELYLLRAQVKLDQDDLEGALQDAKMANELDLTFLDSYLGLGQAYLANDEPEKALVPLKLYGRYEDENPLYWAYLGRAHHGIEEYETALENYERALEINSDLYEAHLYRGLTYLSLGETKKAINDLYLARKNNPESFEAMFQYAMTLKADKRLQQAITFFNQAEELAISDRQLARLFYNRALTYDSIDLPERAKDDYGLLILLPSNDVPRLWVVRANQYLATPTPTLTQSTTPTPTQTSSPTLTFTVTPSPTSTNTPTATYTQTSTLIPTLTPTPTSTHTNTTTPTLTPTTTLTKSPTSTPSP